MRIQDGIPEQIYKNGNLVEERMWKRINVDEAKKILQKWKNEGYELRMDTNPYNPRVIRVDPHKGEDYGLFNKFWFDNLTDNTEEELLKFADEHLHDRLW